MSLIYKGGQTEGVCQVDYSAKKPLPQKSYSRSLLTNYTPESPANNRGLLQTESITGFDGWLKFEPVAETESIDGSERYRITYWGLRPEKGQQPPHWGYVNLGGQWHKHEIQELERQFDSAGNKRDFVLKRLDGVLDAIAASSPSTASTSECEEVAA